MAIDFTLARERVQLEEEKAYHKGRLKSIEGQLDAIEGAVITMLVNERLPSIKVEAEPWAKFQADLILNWAKACHEAGKAAQPMPEAPMATALIYSHTPPVRNLSIGHDVFASPVDGEKESVIEALRDCDLGDYVTETYNSQSLQAYVREIAQQVKEACTTDGVEYTADAIKKALPEKLAERLKVSIVPVLRTRKA